MTNCPICGGVQGPHNSVLPGCECSYRMMKLDDEWKARLEAAVLAEREACAQAAEEWLPDSFDEITQVAIAAKIREGLGDRMKYRKKPVVIDATQWFKNGDHPLDYTERNDGRQSPEYRRRENWEGDVVRYYRRPDDDGERACEKCGNRMHDHGWIDTLEGGHIVCPGDWIITGVKGEHYPCKPDIFAATYENPRKGEGMSIETGGPAFPHPAGWRRDPHISDGMTLRDYFAAAALTGILADASHNAEKRFPHATQVAWRYADEMLKARGQE